MISSVDSLPRTFTKGKTAIYGGTFDPPHLGHLQVAAELSEMGFQEVRIFPTGDKHYRSSDFLSKEKRLNLCKLAFKGIKTVKVDPFEAETPGFHTTFGTLSHLGSSAREDLCFIVGSDQFAKLESWAMFPDLLECCHWITLKRNSTDDIEKYPELLNRWENLGLIKKNQSGFVTAKRERKFWWLNTQAPEISSSQIRSWLGSQNLKQVKKWIVPATEPLLLQYVQEGKEIMAGTTPSKLGNDGKIHHASNPDGAQKAIECAKMAIDKKAEHLVVLDVSELSGFTDFFVIASAQTDRQVLAIADAIEESLLQKGHSLVAIEGLPDGRWVLMDFGDVVVHLFIDALRDYYDLENLWNEAPKIPIPSSFYGPGASRLN